MRAIVASRSKAMKALSRLFAALLLLPLVMACQHHHNTHANNTVSTAAIASAHPLATQAGKTILAQGGNAFDAAVAVSAALAVVEPAGSGLGGGGFWLLHRAHDQQTVMLDGRETAPIEAQRDMYLDKQGQFNPQLSLNGPLAAGIPGLPAALVHLSQHYGKLPLAQSLAPAIQYASEGFIVSEHYHHLAKYRLAALQASASASAIFLDNASSPQAGFKLRQPELAQTLMKIAQSGHAGFYQGITADALVSGVQQAGGIWTHEDLARYRAIERPVIKSQYAGYTLYSASPPSSGGIVLTSILNQLSALPYQSADKGLKRHILVEAMRRAYLDRSRYLGDADFITIPSYLTTAEYGQQLASTIDLNTASPSNTPTTPASQGEDTSHFSIIDHEGNRVAATLSINYPFGSGFVAPGTGVLLNNEMDDFSAQPGRPNGYGLTGAEANAIAPLKRPLSSMSPTFIENESRLMVIGTPGGSRIITMVLLGILDFIDGKSAKDIVSAPRFHHQYLPDVVQLEQTGWTQQDKADLLHYGHQIKLLPRQYGNMQTIIVNKTTGEVDAASDPRGEGQAIVIPPDAPHR